MFNTCEVGYVRYVGDRKNEIIRIYQIVRKYNSLGIYPRYFYLNSFENGFIIPHICEIWYLENTDNDIILCSFWEFSHIRIYERYKCGRDIIFNIL